MKYLTDVIKPLDYLGWGDSDIYIQAPTGCGKTYFILHNIVPMAMQRGTGVLILCNRKNLLLQYNNDIIAQNQELVKCGNDNLFRYLSDGMLLVTTYQAIAASSKYDQIIARFGVVVCDEVHALYADSQFATNLYIAFDKILQWSFGRLMLFVSATAEHIFPILYHEKWKRCYTDLHFKQIDWNQNQSIPGYYKVEADYSFCEVKYLREIEQIPSLIQQDQDLNSKWIVFVPSIGEGKAIEKGLRRIGQTDVFLLTKKSASSVQGEKICEQLTRYHTFEPRILISTPVLEAGVSVCELNVKNVIDLHFLRESFVQTLGRKRLQQGEQINLYILNRGKVFFSRKQFFGGQILKEASVIDNKVQSQYIQGYIANRLLEKNEEIEALKTFLFCDVSGKYQINPISQKKARDDYNFYTEMVRLLALDKTAFIRRQLLWLGLGQSYSEDNWIKEFRNDEIEKEVLGYLEKSVDGTPMDRAAFSKFKLELSRLFHRLFPEEPFRSDRPMCTSKLVRKMKSMNLPFDIVSENVDRKKQYRVVKKCC